MAEPVSGAWERWVERLLPPGLDEQGGVRARFLVRGWTLASAFAAVTTTLYVLDGTWSQVGLTGALAVGGPVILWLHRRGVPFIPLAHASMLLASLCLGLGALAQHPVDYSSLAMLLLVPLLASLLLESRRALPWLVFSILLAAFVSWAGDRGMLLGYVDPQPTMTHVINLSVGFLLAWLFARSRDEVGAQALERLRAADRSRRAFLANISHEIRTPMNGVLGMTEVLLQETLTEGHREQLLTIQRSGRTLVTLINDLLDLSKMEAGKLALEVTDFDLRTVLADVQALAAPHAAAKGLALTVVRGPGVPDWLRGDGHRLGQVLTNLLSNAVKFTASGQVRLEVSRSGREAPGHYTFSVSDTGVGIGPETLSRLFNAFQQGDSSTTRRYGGTGLGLVLSQQIVALMGGSIQAESTPGLGSRFSFSVAFAPGQAISGEHAALVPGDAGPRLPVLVVDDNPVNLKVAMSLVEKAGFQAVGAENGKQALAAVAARPFALVLMDCHMPEMDGFEATERIRALTGERSHTPIVALTASAMPDELAACRRVGMNSVLAKPVTFAAIRGVLQSQAQ